MDFRVLRFRPERSFEKWHNQLRFERIFRDGSKIESRGDLCTLSCIAFLQYLTLHFISQAFRSVLNFHAVSRAHMKSFYLRCILEYENGRR